MRCCCPRRRPRESFPWRVLAQASGAGESPPKSHGAKQPRRIERGAEGMAATCSESALDPHTAARMGCSDTRGEGSASLVRGRGGAESGHSSVDTGSMSARLLHGVLSTGIN